MSVAHMLRGAAGAPLGKHAKTVEVSPRRTVRYQARDLLSALSQNKRVTRCGRAIIRTGGVQVRCSADGRAGFAGLATCGSVWACPVCSAKILHGRTDEVTRAITTWTDVPVPRDVLMLTLTVRHDRSMPLGLVWDGILAAWRRMVQRKGWTDTKRALNVEAYLRVTEVTFGAEGWHVHFHVLLFSDAWVTAKILRKRRGKIRSAWVDCVAAQGLSAVEGVQDLRRMAGSDLARVLGEYVTKNTYDDSAKVTADQASALAMEVTRGDLKEGRFGNRTPFQVLRELLATVQDSGDLDGGLPWRSDLSIWLEWEKSSQGRRSHVWSQGARDLLGLGDEVADEALAAEEIGTHLDAVLDIPKEGWAVVLRIPGTSANLLAAVEVWHREAPELVAWNLATWLDDRGIAWSPPSA